MPTYEIGGIPVHFPYEAYSPQLAYMETVIRALQRGENALLESPTGTGKTLCLLCATLAYRTAVAAKMQLDRQAGAPMASYDVYVGKESVPQPMEMSATASKLGRQLDSLVAPSQRHQVPLIIYASRTHSQLSQVVGELRKTAYRPKVVIVGSREQQCTNGSVRSLRSNGAMTAMCGQLVKKAACPEYMRVGEALARLDLCKRDEPDRILDMEDLMKIAKSHGACPYFLAKNELADAELILMPYNYLIDCKAQGALAGLALEHSIIIFDEAHNVEGSCGEARSTDIGTRQLLVCRGEIDQVNEMMRTGTIYPGSLTHQTLQHARDTVEIMREALLGLTLDQEDGQLRREGSFAHAFFGAKADLTEDTAKGMVLNLEAIARVYVEGMYQRRKQQGIHSALQSLASALRTIFGITTAVDDDNGDDEKEGPRGQRKHRETIEGNDHRFYRVFVSIDRQPEGSSGVKKPSSHSAQPRDRTLSYWCFHPGVAMRELVLGRRIHSLLLTSGTLSPLDSFRAEMGVPFPHQLENEHVVSEGQVFCRILGTGPHGHHLNASYAQRDSLEYRMELGRTIVGICQAVPDGLLVFFPSYPVMENCLASWKSNGNGDGYRRRTDRLSEASIYDQIKMTKGSIFVEPKNKEELPAIMAAYGRAIIEDGSAGAILMAVCRGKVSEGLDFSDAKCRAVIVTGIPYPPLKDARVILKRQYLDERLREEQFLAKTKNPSVAKAFLSGDQWYGQQAARAVNQAIGRVIRHKNDYGAIILLDERFATARSIGQLSRWVRSRVRSGDSFAETIAELGAFFRRMARRQEGNATTMLTAMDALIDPPLIIPAPAAIIEEAKSFFVTAPSAVVSSIEDTIPSSLCTVTTATTTAMGGTRTMSIIGGGGENPLIRAFAASVRPLVTGISARERAQHFLDHVKAALPSAQQRSFTLAIKKYRGQQLAIGELINQILDLFMEATAEKRDSLCRGFRDFINARHRPLYDSIFARRCGNPGGDSATSIHSARKRPCTDASLIDQSPLVAATAPVPSPISDFALVTGPAPELSFSIPIAPSPPCPICKDTIKNGYKAKCGHVCCFSCWGSWLQVRLECPLCRLRTRIPQLKKEVL